MKKTGYIMSILIMCLAVVVGLVGVTAAWFGDTNSRTNIITVTSGLPHGAASIVADSTSDFPLVNEQKLRPAMLKAGYALADRDGSENYDQLAVPYVLYTASESGGSTTYTPQAPVDPGTLLDTTNNLETTNKPFYSAATSVTTSFKFNFLGTPDTYPVTTPPNPKAGTKHLRISLTSVTLVNPRTTVTVGETSSTVVNHALADYKAEFESLMTISCDEGVSSPGGAALTGNPTSKTGHVIDMWIKPGPVYTFTVTVWFKYADEFTSADLIDKTLFFNFELETISVV